MAGPPEGSPGGSQAAPPVARSRSLSSHAARGGMTMGVAAAIEQGAMLLRAIILARLLSPLEFGIMGMALVAVRAGDAFSHTGFSRALVQKRGDVSGYLDTVWIVQAVRGLALCGIAWGIAPLAAGFFSTPQLTPVLRVVSLVFITQGLISPGLFMLERELAFKRQAIPSLVGNLVDLAIAVTLAVQLRSVWAMVYGLICGKIVYVVGTYLVRPWRPAFRFRWHMAVEFYRYGRHVFRATAVDWIVSQLDRVLVGRLLGASALGVYSVAGRLSNSPATGLNSVILRVAFPIFTRVQDDPERLRAGLLRAVGTMALLAGSVGAGLWAVAPDFVMVVLTEEWLGAVPILRIMSVGGIAIALGFTLRTILGAIGFPDAAARGSYAFLLTMVIPIYPATLQWGAKGAACCVAGASFVSTIYLLLLAGRKARASLAAQARGVLPAAGAALGMILAVGSLRTILDGRPSALTLAAEVLLGAAVFPLLAWWLDTALGAGILPPLARAFSDALGRGRARPKG